MLFAINLILRDGRYVSLLHINLSILRVYTNVHKMITFSVSPFQKKIISTCAVYCRKHRCKNVYQITFGIRIVFFSKTNTAKCNLILVLCVLLELYTIYYPFLIFFTFCRWREWRKIGVRAAGRRRVRTDVYRFRNGRSLGKWLKIDAFSKHKPS